MKKMKSQVKKISLTPFTPRSPISPIQFGEGDRGEVNAGIGANGMEISNQ